MFSISVGDFFRINHSIRTKTCTDFEKYNFLFNIEIFPEIYLYICCGECDHKKIFRTHFLWGMDHLKKYLKMFCFMYFDVSDKKFLVRVKCDLKSMP